MSLQTIDQRSITKTKYKEKTDLYFFYTIITWMFGTYRVFIPLAIA